MSDKIKPATRADTENVAKQPFPNKFLVEKYIATLESWEPVMAEVASIDIADSGCLFCMDDGVNHVDGCPVPNACKLMEAWNG